MTTTQSATLWLASIRTALVPESYSELMSTVEDIANEHKAEQLDRSHVELALRRLGAGNGNHSKYGGKQK